MAIAQGAANADGTRAVPGADGWLTGRLSALMFMQFFVWGAWNVTLGLVMQTVGIGSLIGNAFSVGPIASIDRKSTRLNSSHIQKSRMPSSA